MGWKVLNAFISTDPTLHKSLATMGRIDFIFYKRYQVCCKVLVSLVNIVGLMYFYNHIVWRLYGGYKLRYSIDIILCRILRKKSCIYESLSKISI